MIGVLAAAAAPDAVLLARAGRPVAVLHRRRRRLRRRVQPARHRRAARLAGQQLPRLVLGHRAGDHGPARTGPSLSQELEDSFCRTDPEIARRFAHVTFLSDNRADLARVRTPTLVLQCTDDVIAPVAVGEYVHEHIPGSTLVLLDSTGHCPHMSAPDQTADAIDTVPGLRRRRRTMTAGDGDVVDGFIDALLDDDAQTLYDRAPCGYLSSTPDGTIVKVNATFLALTGYATRRPRRAPAFRRPAHRRRTDLPRDALRADVAPARHRPRDRARPRLRGRAPPARPGERGARARRRRATRCHPHRGVRRIPPPALRGGAASREAAGDLARQDVAADAHPAARARTSTDCRSPRSTAPPGDGTEVGGDFYDIFQADDDDWVVTIGDVCGKGADAAVVTALARYTLRAAAVQDPSPALGLSLLNDALNRADGEPVLHRGDAAASRGWTARGSCPRCVAGHPLPLHVNAGHDVRVRPPRHAAGRAERGPARSRRSPTSSPATPSSSTPTA